jgi:hypothetical protein
MSEGGAIQWGRADLAWKPDISRLHYELRVPAYIDRYAAELLKQTLKPTLERALREPLSNNDITLEVIFGRRYREGGTSGFEPGEIVITGERLMDVLDPAEICPAIDGAVAEAVREGDAWRDRETERAAKFRAALLEAGN